ncbi:hypothetical protein [Pedobacter frigiditerrae]|uniref:hypothetical protein n=1 Tax=Pedobacter frigiditerrae TaxID=2530452 RepID=UPI0029310133|nr:hypothetical protein [Pedobacter frigiditerrae]
MGKQDKINQDDKPVGYGSSIQSSGHGNRSRPKQPTDKIQIPDQNSDQEKKAEEK